jgi:8-oxo-dGTP pyrophosphatase MutT (NUDIX family)
VENPGLPVSRAAGFVLSREGAGGEPEYLLLDGTRDGAPGFPKGHADAGEDDLSTALRETREETGLSDLAVDPWFRAEISYRVRKAGGHRWKTVVYLRARLRSGEVRLSDEHSGFAWLPLPEAMGRLSFDSLRETLWKAALHAKDPVLFRMRPPATAAALRHLESLPHAEEALVLHLRGAARLARAIADALAAAGARVHAEAAEQGTLLHDVGRALGRHEDHQLAGIEHLRATGLAPYAFACVTHFTKGASGDDLVAAGLPPETLARFRRAIDVHDLTLEERCAALADSCMKGPTPVPPAERFADLRRRYPGAHPLVALQERRTAALREEVAALLGRDPLALVGLG